jgi:GNAT superfamily N-acetyltransferase
LQLQSVGRDAARRFAVAGLGRIADEPPTAVERFEAAAAAGALQVAIDGDNRPIGFALLDRRDGVPWLEELGVCLECQGQGAGRVLLAAAEAATWHAGEPWLVLETFADLPWNGPWCRGQGYEPLPDHAIGPDLKAQAERSAARWPGLKRILLRKRLAAPTG